MEYHRRTAAVAGYGLRTAVVVVAGAVVVQAVADLARHCLEFAIEHLHFIDNNLGRVTVAAVLRLPFPSLQFTIDVNL